MVQARGEAEAAVVLGERFFLVPGKRSLENVWGGIEGEEVPVLCDDGVLEDLLLRGPVLALLRDGGLVLLFLEFATHVGVFVGV
jgi:hypothetical protein